MKPTEKEESMEKKNYVEAAVEVSDEELDNVAGGKLAQPNESGIRKNESEPKPKPPIWWEYT